VGWGGQTSSLTPVSLSHGHGVDRRLDYCPFLKSRSQNGVADDNQFGPHSVPNIIGSAYKECLTRTTGLGTFVLVVTSSSPSGVH
jgi:hypothetical protein